METEKDKKTEPKQPQRLAVATQKTFNFFFWQSASSIDKKINAWLMRQTLIGQAPMLGKVTATFIQVKYVFLYSSFIEKPNEDKKNKS